jgi:hypothetical protein
VCGHYPIYTSGEHGDNSELISTLQPLISKFNVSVYLAGHDHLSGHLQYDNIEYFIAGGGAMVDPLGDVKSVATDVWYGEGYSAFSVLQVTAETLTIKFVHWNGSEMYNYTLRNPRHPVFFNVPPTPSPTFGPKPRLPGSLFSELFGESIPYSYVYITVAAGSVAGLLVSIILWPHRKTRRGKRKSHTKKNKTYTTVPGTPSGHEGGVIDAQCSYSPSEEVSPSTCKNRLVKPFKRRHVYSPVGRSLLNSSSPPRDDHYLNNPSEVNHFASPNRLCSAGDALIGKLSGNINEGRAGHSHRRTKSNGTLDLDSPSDKSTAFGHIKSFSYAENV